VPFARTDDRVRLYHEEHGRGGTPLVLACGIGGNADMWDVNRDALAAHHRLVLWQPRGHARSDSPEDPARYSLRRWAPDLKTVLDPSLAPMKVMHRKVCGSKLVVLSPASHFGNRDQPEVWNRTVLEFLARCDRRARG
jgi:pimeloyl-ACP methyl ester carboxylesterase